MECEIHHRNKYSLQIKPNEKKKRSAKEEEDYMSERAAVNQFSQVASLSDPSVLPVGARNNEATAASAALTGFTRSSVNMEVQTPDLQL